MLTTSINQLGFSVADSTVLVNPGTVRVGNDVMSFRGGSIVFSDMVSFGGDSSKYQNSALFLQSIGGETDMTTVVSSAESSMASLEAPTLPSDSSNPYSPVHALGLFTFWTPDGIDISLVSQSCVE